MKGTFKMIRVGTKYGYNLNGISLIEEQLFKNSNKNY
jgi:hypothetical protein